MAEEVASPINQVEPKPILRKPGEAPVAPTLKLTPVTREAPAVEPPPARETLVEKEEGSAISRLKGLTQKLKSVTQEIPAQAILHRTGIIASQTAASESQEQAAKSKTMRISLTQALGVAPTTEASASPMKTIRIKRPVDLPRPVEQAAAAAAEAEAKPAADTAPTMTQRRTLRVARPSNLGTGAHLKLRRPGAPVAPVKPAGTETAAEAPVADIPEIADLPATPAAPVAAAPAEAPQFVTVLSLFVQIAACALMGFVGWTLFQTYSMLTQ